MTTPSRAGGPGTAPSGSARSGGAPAGGTTAPVVRRTPVATETAPVPVATAGAAPEATGRRVLGYRRQRFEARKVRRLVRHLDPWSVLKLSVLVALCMWLITMIAAVILWTVATNAGTIGSIEDFVNSSLQLQDWKLDGEFLFRQFGLITLLLALGTAAAMVVATLIFNLISDIIGGVWITVIEEEHARPVGEE